MSEHIIKLKNWSATDFSWCYNNIDGVWWVEEKDLEFYFDEAEDANSFENYLKMENVEYDKRRISMVSEVSS